MPETTSKRENLFLNLICNIVIPTLILSKLSGDERLGAQMALIVALAFPLGYGGYDYVQRKSVNLISILGLANVLVTGIVGLLELDGFWIIVKETTMPLLIGLFILLSMNTKRPLVRMFIYNDQVIDVQKIDRELNARGNQAAFEKLFAKATYIMAFSFLISAILNFVIAKAIVKSPGGTEAFNQEIAKMTWVSYIVILVPSLGLSIYAMWKLFAGIKELTGIGLMDVLHGAQEAKEDEKAEAE